MLTQPPRQRPSDALVDKLRIRLDRALGSSKLITAGDGMIDYGSDESEQEPVLPDAVVRAENAEDVMATLAVASELGVAVTPRGGGSGKSGGCVPVHGGVVLCTLAMRDIKEIDAHELLAVVEPGIILADFCEAIEREGLFYPPDPNSLDVCALGGNIAENAGGPRAFKYGVTRDYVLGLDVITAQGTPLSVGRRTVKGVTGYDLTALLVGSEGTLAVTQAATLRLLRSPEKIVTLMALFEDVHAAAEAVQKIVAAGLVPRCLELIDEACLQALRDGGVGVDPHAGAMLIIEVDGDEQSCERDMLAVGERAMDAKAREVLVAQDEAQRTRLWAARRELSHTTRRLARFKISEDVVVPRSQMAQLVAQVQRISEQRDVRMLSFGHAGDGNLHVNLLWDDPAQAPQVEEALEELFKAVLAMRGTLTGEHGVGLSKAPFLALEQSSAAIALQRDIKSLFDPKQILNPGKIFPRGGHRPC